MAQTTTEPQTNGPAAPNGSPPPLPAGGAAPAFAPPPPPPPRAGSWYPVLALVLALLAGIITLSWQRSVYRNITGDKEVVVAARALTPSTRLDEAAPGTSDRFRNVELATRPASSLAESKGVLTSLQEVRGKVVLYPILPGEPIYAERLITAAQLKEQTVAAAEGLPLAYTVSASHFVGSILPPLQRGDLVAIVSFDKRAGYKDFQELLKSGEGVILANRVVVGLPSTKKDTHEWVTIAVTQEEAIKLTAALGSDRALAMVKQRLE